MSLYEETVTRPQGLIDQLALGKEVITNITLDVRQIGENLELYQSTTESKTSCASTMHYNPPPAIPKFTGTVKTWTSFWNAFEAYIDENSNMREIQKLAYLFFPVILVLNIYSTNIPCINAYIALFSSLMY